MVLSNATVVPLKSIFGVDNSCKCLLMLKTKVSGWLPNLCKKNWDKEIVTLQIVCSLQTGALPFSLATSGCLFCSVHLDIQWKGNYKEKHHYFVVILSLNCIPNKADHFFECGVVSSSYCLVRKRFRSGFKIVVLHRHLHTPQPPVTSRGKLW